MELNEMKDLAKNVKAPDIRFRGSQGSAQMLTELIRVMKAEDERDRRRIRRAMLFSAGAGIFCALIFILTWIAPPDTSPGLHRIIFSVFGLLFLSAAFVSRMKTRMLSGVDYAQPIGLFLEDAARRYRFIDPRDIAFGVLYVALFVPTGCVAWLTAMHRYFPSMEPRTSLLVYCCILLVAALIGWPLGIAEWKKRKAPLLQEITRLKSELNATELAANNEESD